MVSVHSARGLIRRQIVLIFLTFLSFSSKAYASLLIEPSFIGQKLQTFAKEGLGVDEMQVRVTKHNFAVVKSTSYESEYWLMQKKKNYFHNRWNGKQYGITRISSEAISVSEKPLTELNLVKLLWGSASRKWFISNPFFFRILQPRSRHDLKYYARKASKTWLVQILW